MATSCSNQQMSYRKRRCYVTPVLEDHVLHIASVPQRLLYTHNGILLPEAGGRPTGTRGTNFQCSIDLGSNRHFHAYCPSLNVSGRNSAIRVLKWLPFSTLHDVLFNRIPHVLIFHGSSKTLASVVQVSNFLKCQLYTD